MRARDWLRRLYPASVLKAPGVVQHIEGDRFPVGEPDGTASTRVKAVSECFTKARFQAPVLDNIRAEIWLKLWGNLTFNPISALSRATLADICQYPPTRNLAAAMMAEAETVANRLGVTFRLSLERRIAGAGFDVLTTEPPRDGHPLLEVRRPNYILTRTSPGRPRARCNSSPTN